MGQRMDTKVKDKGNGIRTQEIRLQPSTFAFLHLHITCLDLYAPISFLYPTIPSYPSPHPLP